MSLAKFKAMFGKGKETVTKAAETAKGALKSKPMKNVGRAAAGVGAYGAAGAALYGGARGLEALLSDDDEGSESALRHAIVFIDDDDEPDDKYMAKRKKKSAELS